MLLQPWFTSLLCKSNDNEINIVPSSFRLINEMLIFVMKFNMLGYMEFTRCTQQTLLVVMQHEAWVRETFRNFATRFYPTNCLFALNDNRDAEMLPKRVRSLVQQLLMIVMKLSFSIYDQIKLFQCIGVFSGEVI